MKWLNVAAFIGLSILKAKTASTHNTDCSNDSTNNPPKPDGASVDPRCFGDISSNKTCTSWDAHAPAPRCCKTGDTGKCSGKFDIACMNWQDAYPGAWDDDGEGNGNLTIGEILDFCNNSGATFDSLPICKYHDHVHGNDTGCGGLATLNCNSDIGAHLDHLGCNGQGSILYTDAGWDSEDWKSWYEENCK